MEASGGGTRRQLGLRGLGGLKRCWCDLTGRRVEKRGGMGDWGLVPMVLGLFHPMRRIYKSGRGPVDDLDFKLARSVTGYNKPNDSRTSLSRDIPERGLPKRRPVEASGISIG